MFWKEQPRRPVEGVFRSLWSGGDFIVYDASGTEVFRIRSADSRVGLRFAPGIVDEDALADLAVTTNKIFPAAVGSSSLMDHSIGYVKLHDDVLQSNTVTIESADVKTLNATAVELVEAPGAGNAIQFIDAVLTLDYTAAYTGNHALIIGFSGGSVPVATNIAHGDFIQKTADSIFIAQPLGQFDASIAAVENEALVLSAEDGYAGDAGNDNQVTVTVTYRIIPVG